MATLSSNKSRLSVPLLLIVVLVPLAGALWWYLDHAASGRSPVVPAALSAEAKAYVANLKLAGVAMKATENYAGAAVVEINGQITNKGTQTLNRVELNCVFFDASGLVVFRERVPIVRSMLKPGESRTFRLPFEGIPGSWNQALPQLVIAHVAFGA